MSDDSLAAAVRLLAAAIDRHATALDGLAAAVASDACGEDGELPPPSGQEM